MRPRSTLMATTDRKIVWIDIGGGTGWNIERMNAFIPIVGFHSVYLVDITPSLCKVAQTRFMRLGWHNVKVYCMDALEFELPKEDRDVDVEVALVTMSYSCKFSIYQHTKY